MPIQPMSGMAAWKKPNRKAIQRMMCHMALRKMTPLTMDTAKQSNASAIESSRMSPKFMSRFGYLRDGFTHAGIGLLNVQQLADGRCNIGDMNFARGGSLWNLPAEEE